MNADSVAAGGPLPFGLFSMPFFGLIVLIVLGVLYFMPVIIANHEKHHAITAVALLNIFLGWTVVGWFAALIWAYHGRQASVAVPERPLRACLKCGAIASLADRFCPQCGTAIQS